MSKAPDPDQLAAAAAEAVDVEPDALAVTLTDLTLVEPDRFAALRERAGLEPLAADVALPDEHQPGERRPQPNPSPDTPTPPAMAGDGMAWQAVFAPEGRLTDDRRAFAPGAITWRELPLTLMAMTETSEGGHVGAEVAGRIDRIWRDEQAGLIRAEGVFDSGDYGREIARMVGDGTLRGVSVDLAIRSADQAPRSDYFDADGNWAPQEPSGDGPSLVDILFGPEGGDDDPLIFVVTDAVIGMTTVCPFPAFAEATIQIQNEMIAGGSPAVVNVTGQAGWVLTPVHASVNAPDPEPALTAAAAGLVPEQPPAEWFDDPQLDELTALTVTEDGRVFGHAWAWDTCHTGFPGRCTTAPHSVTDYAWFHLGEVVCDGGQVVPVGKITLDTGHADRGLGRADATAHYDDTGTVAAYVCVGEDEHGGWFAGALSPRADADKVRVLRGATLSGDWRNVDGNGLELVALLAVNVPGFPVPRARAAIVAGGDTNADVVALVAAGLVLPLDQVDAAGVIRFEALRARSDVRFAELAARAA